MSKIIKPVKSRIVRPYNNKRHIKGGAYPDRMRHILVRCKDKADVMVGVDGSHETGGMIKIIKNGKVFRQVPIKAREQIRLVINEAFGFRDHKVDQLRPNGEMYIREV